MNQRRREDVAPLNGVSIHPVMSSMNSHQYKDKKKKHSSAEQGNHAAEHTETQILSAKCLQRQIVYAESSQPGV